jgi:FKBP-type peptidyl-prolyl cis-trans isomerase FkpA
MMCKEDTAMQGQARGQHKLKRYSSGLLLITGLLTGATQVAAAEMSETEKTFYYLGSAMGRNLETLELTDREKAAVVNGLRETLADEEQQLDDIKYTRRVNELTQQRIARAASARAAEGKQYLAAMAVEEGAVTTESGLIYRELEPGNGAQPTATSAVRAHYTGTLPDGTVFDSSVPRGQPLTVRLDQVIVCWTEGIALMKTGGTSKLTCPPDIAYGATGKGSIPPGAVLSFDVELLEVLD